MILTFKEDCSDLAYMMSDTNIMGTFLHVTHRASRKIYLGKTSEKGISYTSHTASETLFKRLILVSELLCEGQN